MDKQFDKTQKALYKLRLGREDIKSIRRQLNYDIRKFSRRKEVISILIDEYNKMVPIEKVINNIKFDRANLYSIEIADLHYRGSDECEDNFRRLRNAILSVLRSLPKNANVRLCFLGDDIQGELRESDLLQNKETAVAQALRVSELYKDLIRKAVKIRHIEIVFVPKSNHNEIRFKGAAKALHPQSNLGYVIWNALKRIEGVKFYKEILPGIIETKDAYYIHGDQQWAKSNKRTFGFLVERLGKAKDVHKGHFHHLNIEQVGRYMVLGAPKANSIHSHYELDAGFLESPAQFVVHRKKNGIYLGTDVITI